MISASPGWPSLLASEHNIYIILFNCAFKCIFLFNNFTYQLLAGINIFLFLHLILVSV